MKHGGVLTIVALPLVFVIANLLAITNPGIARVLPAPEACTHVNCLFLLSPPTVYQLSLIAICTTICLGYFAVMQLLSMRTNREMRIQQILLSLAFYCLYVQILRIPLALTFFQNNLRWWMPLISRISIFTFPLHACVMLIHSFRLIIRHKLHIRTWAICGVVISLWIAYTVPLDRHLLTEQLIHKVGYLGQLQVFIVIVHTVTMINYIKHYVETRRKNILWLNVGHILQALTIHALFAPHTNSTTVGITLAALFIAAVGIIGYTHTQLRVRE